MPESNRRPTGNYFKTWAAFLLAGSFLLSPGCGEQEVRSSAVAINSAEKRGERILVSGDWARGVSTPPSCRILEGRDGPMSGHFGLDARVALDGSAFSKEFVPVETSGESLTTREGDYYVNCSVSLDSGRPSEDTVKVEQAS